jgi:hypothetical protein
LLSLLVRESWLVDLLRAVLSGSELPLHDREFVHNGIDMFLVGNGNSNTFYDIIQIVDYDVSTPVILIDIVIGVEEVILKSRKLICSSKDLPSFSKFLSLSSLCLHCR